MKLTDDVVVPNGVVTLSLPVIDPAGTVAVIDVSDFTRKDAAFIPLNLTAVAPLKFAPVIVTTIPARPVMGVKAARAGPPPAVTVKLFPLVAVPAGLVTLILPVVAPEGTLVVIELSELIANPLLLTPLNFTDVAVEKFVPVIDTIAPTLPEVGVKEVMVGGIATIKFLSLVAVPATVVTVIGPVVAPAGTVDEI